MNEFYEDIKNSQAVVVNNDLPLLLRALFESDVSDKTGGALHFTFDCNDSNYVKFLIGKIQALGLKCDELKMIVRGLQHE